MSTRISNTNHEKLPGPSPVNGLWVPDLGNGRYRNPILCADYSDPDVVRLGENYYLTASSFNCTPGLPILHSRDLVNWTLVNHAVKNLPASRYDEVQPGCGIWAPSIRFHDGRFWIFFAMPDEGIYATTTADPAGPWSRPHLLAEGNGMIDPCPFWDEDGQAYLVHAYAKSRAGIKHCLRLRPMAPDASHLLGEGSIIFNEPEKHPTLEGPKFLKRNGWYYLFAPAGGVATGWQTVLRSRNIFGPYEDRIVLEQGDSPVNGPHQGGFVDTPDGQWWFVHFQDAGVYGRITHLQPMRWEDDWPLVGIDQDGNGIGEPVLEHNKPVSIDDTTPVVPATSDEFDAATLGLQWQWNANHRDEWVSLNARPGWARLVAQWVPQNDLALAPHLMMQKFPAPEFVVETCLELPLEAVGTEAGLIVLGRQHAAIALKSEGDSYNLLFRNGNESQLLLNSRVDSIRLRVEVSAGGLCHFAYGFGGDRFVYVPETFQAVEGYWVGARVGLYAASDAPSSAHYADFDYFRFSQLPVDGQHTDNQDGAVINAPSWLNRPMQSHSARQESESELNGD